MMPKLPGAAVGLAAVLHNKIDIKGKTVAVVATGGNVDAASFCTALGAAASLEQGDDRDGT